MEVNKIAVIGSGTMGRGIAYTAALSGFEVTLQDISAEALEQANDYNVSLANQVLKKGYITSEQRDFVQQNLTYTTELQEAVRVPI